MNLTNEEYIEHAKDKEIDRLRVSNAMLRSENTKLREMASVLCRCWKWEESCEGCPMLDDDGWCNRDIRLRELGVEVE